MMKHLIVFIVLVFAAQVAFAQQVSCSNQKTGKKFLTAKLKNNGEGQVYLDSIKILSTNESTALAKGSLASDIDYRDYKSYAFRSSKPKSLVIVDPNEPKGIFGDLFSGEASGDNVYIGKGRIWVYQNQSAEFDIENHVVFTFDYKDAVSKKPFKLSAWHDIDQYYNPMDQKLICSFK